MTSAVVSLLQVEAAHSLFALVLSYCFPEPQKAALPAMVEHLARCVFVHGPPVQAAAHIALLLVSHFVPSHVPPLFSQHCLAFIFALHVQPVGQLYCSRRRLYLHPKCTAPAVQREALFDPSLGAHRRRFGRERGRAPLAFEVEIAFFA